MRLGMSAVAFGVSVSLMEQGCRYRMAQERYANDRKLPPVLRLFAPEIHQNDHGYGKCIFSSRILKTR